MTHFQLRVFHFLGCDKGEGVKDQRWQSVTWEEGVTSIDFLSDTLFVWPLNGHIVGIIFKILNSNKHMSFSSNLSLKTYQIQLFYEKCIQHCIPYFEGGKYFTNNTPRLGSIWHNLSFTIKEKLWKKICPRICSCNTDNLMKLSISSIPRYFRYEELRV